MTRRQRINSHKADLLDRFSQDTGNFDPPYGATPREVKDFEVAQRELANELYRRAVRLTPPKELRDAEEASA